MTLLSPLPSPPITLPLLYAPPRVLPSPPHTRDTSSPTPTLPCLL